MTELEQLQLDLQNAQKAYDDRTEKFRQERLDAIALLNSIKSKYSDSVNGFATRSFNDMFGNLQPTGPNCTSQASCKDDVAAYNQLLYLYKIDKNTAQTALLNNLNAAKDALNNYLAQNPQSSPLPTEQPSNQASANNSVAATKDRNIFTLQNILLALLILIIIYSLLKVTKII